HGLLDVVTARLGLFHALAQAVLDEQAGGTAEHHQIQQRVATQAVGAVDRHTGHLTYGEQPVDDLVVAFVTTGEAQGLPVNVGRDTAHHVVAGRHHRHRLFHRVGVGEGL